MTYNDVKTAPDGRVYSGAPIGLAHHWRYEDCFWDERKSSPDRWTIGMRATKRRMAAAPENSGAEVGGGFTWLVVGWQRVRKVDANAYETFLQGVKWKVAHRRPHWQNWSSTYEGQTRARPASIGFLRGFVEELERSEDDGQEPLEKRLGRIHHDPWARTFASLRSTA